MIDRSLNYGRHLIYSFLQLSTPFNCVLDLGAGGGDDLMLAKSVNPEAHLLAVEAYAPNVERLRSQGINVFSANIERDALTVDDEECDVVIANQILEHTKEVYWIFHEISRVLPVGGKLIIGVPNLASLHNRILLLLGKQPSVLKTSSAHVRGFTKNDIIQFLESCFPNGYVLKSFGGSNFYPFPPIFAKPLATVFPTFAWGIFFLLQKVRSYNGEFLEFPIKQQLETNFWLGKDV
jgi:SAM-dependent methyltransferase